MSTYRFVLIIYFTFLIFKLLLFVDVSWNDDRKFKKSKLTKIYLKKRINLSWKAINIKNSL